MNRIVVFGIATFLAIVGISLLGGESQAVAGHGCHGACAGGGGFCDGGGYGCAGAACHGRRGGLFHRCHGGGGLFHRMRNRGCHGCQGYVDPCACHGAAVVDHGCAGGGAVPYQEGMGGYDQGYDQGGPPPAPQDGGRGAQDDVPPPPQQDGQSASLERAPMVFHQVSFRR